MWSAKIKPIETEVELEALRPEEHNAHPRERSSIGSPDTITRSKHPQWKKSIRYCAFAGGFVFLVNLFLLLYGEGRAGFPSFSSNGGKRTFYDGDCNTTKKINVGIHLIINILSTIILGASNYCMQCMSAPTRAEAEQAHSKFSWVDIGVPSVRNLKMIRRLRVVLWFLLGATSLPLHLFFNSTVFASITASEYFIFTVNEGFLDAPPQNFSRLNFSDDESYGLVFDHMLDLRNSSSLERLSPADCVTAYAQNYQSARGNLLLVTPDSKDGLNDTYHYGPIALFNGGLAPSTTAELPFHWICQQYFIDGSCANAIPQVQSNIGDWRPFGKQVQYCLSETMVQHCRVQYSAQLLLVVVIIGLVKTAAMLYIAFGVQDIPLLTIGDAVSSFLTKPEPRTLGMCLLDKSLKHFEPSVTYVQRTSSGEYNSLAWTAPPRYFQQERRRQCIAASGRRWSVFLLTFVTLISASIYLLDYGASWYQGGTPFSAGNIGTFFAHGFGSVDPSALISWSLPTSGAAALISNVMVANIPQLLLSFLYLNYNGIMTVMSLARETSRYGIRRNGLRVSGTPRGAQRSTYFLQLPYRFAIPIIVVTGVLHWLISQSIFLVSIEAILLAQYTPNNTHIWDTESPTDLITCGYSLVAILASILVAFFLLIGIVGMGCVKLPSSMPVAASCSTAIAAACHPPIEEMDDSIAERKFMWGQTGEDDAGIGHCAFSSREVTQPEQGNLFA